MKLLPLVALCLVCAPIAQAQSVFPGLQAVLTETEWKRAGLDRLSPDQLGVIDAALIKHQARVLKAATADVAAIAVGPAPRTVAPMPPAPTSLWDKFGLPRFMSDDWRSQPPLVARVRGWLSPNRFELENGQVWEGMEKIPMELAGLEVTIEARPNDSFSLKTGDSVSVRVRRVK